MIDNAHGRVAAVVTDQVRGDSFRDCDHRSFANGSIKTVFKRGRNRVEDVFPPSDAPFPRLERKVPRAIADVACEDVAAKATESLRMDYIESAADLQGGWRREAEDRGEGVCSPSGDDMKMNAIRLAGFNPIGVNVHFVFRTEPGRQLGDIAAMSARTVIVMQYESDFHAGDNWKPVSPQKLQRPFTPGNPPFYSFFVLLRIGCGSLAVAAMLGYGQGGGIRDEARTPIFSIRCRSVC